MNTATKLRDEDFWADLRKIRTDQLVGHIMHVVGKYICEHDDERRNHEKATRELWELFYGAGAEIVTDDTRRQAGLPPRGGKGWTREELQILEAKRIEALLNPAPVILAR